MGQRVDSDALTSVAQVLGISGTGAKAGVGSAFTELDESRLDQIVSVNDMVRRSRAPAGTAGWFFAAFDCNMGAGVTSETASLNVYAPGASLVNAPFTGVVPRDFDIWLIGHSAVISGATAGNFSDAGLRLECPVTHEGVGVQEDGSKPSPTVGNFQLVSWDSTIVVGGRQILIDANGNSYFPLGIRIRRGQLLKFDCSATNVVVVRGTCIMAMLPAGLGQDVGP